MSNPQKHMTVAEFKAHAFNSQSEEDFKRWLLRYAELRGWMRCHFRPALRMDGSWYTPVEGDSGWPDVMLKKAGRPLHVWEVKTMTGTLRPDQRAWLAALTDRDWSPSDSGIVWPAGRGFSAGVVRPDMRQEIEEELS